MEGKGGKGVSGFAVSAAELLLLLQEGGEAQRERKGADFAPRNTCSQKQGEGAGDKRFFNRRRVPSNFAIKKKGSQTRTLVVVGGKKKSRKKRGKKI